MRTLYDFERDDFPKSFSLLHLSDLWQSSEQMTYPKIELFWRMHSYNSSFMLNLPIPNDSDTFFLSPAKL